MARSELEIIIGLTDKTKGPLGSIGRNLQKVGKIAMGAALGGVAALGAGIFLVAKKAIPAASDLVESINAVNVVFEDNADTILEWGKTAAETAGLSQAEFAQMAAQTGAMLQNFGLDAETAADATINLAQRAADMASIFNTDVDQALTAIQAGLRGEADPLEKFGVSLSAVAVKAKALALGLEGADGELDNTALTTARLALLFEQTDKIAGDFVNTSGDLANAQRVAKAQLENFMASIGKLALPILGKLFSFISGKLIPSFQSIFDLLVTGDFTGGIFGLTEDHPFILALFRFREILLGVGEAFSNFLGFIRQGSDVLASLTRLVYDLAMAFGASSKEAVEISTTFYNIIAAVIEFKDRLMEMLQPIIDWVANNVTLKDVLIALGIAILAVVIPAVISLLATLLPIIAVGAALILAVTLIRKAWESNWHGIRDTVMNIWNNILKPNFEKLKEWLAVFIPQAIEKLKDFWVNVLKPALETFWGWIQSTVFPLLQTLWDWLAVNVPAAIQTLTDFWNNTLLPAIKAVWKFLSDDMMPVWVALGELLEVTVGTAIEILTALWENVLQPALQSIWEFIRDNIIPIFDGMSSSIGGITGAIEKVVGWINDLVAAIKNLPDNLPSWITGQSPSPFETSLTGVTSALALLNDEMKVFDRQMNFRTPALVTASISGAGQDIGAGSRSQNLTLYGDMIFPNVTDRASFLEEISELMT